MSSFRRMLGMVELLWNWLVSLTKSRRRLEAEILLLRHQLNILRRKAPRRMRLTDADRLVFVWLYRLCPAAADAVRPAALPATTLQRTASMAADDGKLRLAVEPGSRHRATKEGHCMQQFRTKRPAQNRVMALFEAGLDLFEIPRAATLGDLAERLGDLSERHGER